MSIYADRVNQPVTSPGTGPLTFGSTPAAGYQTFLSAFGSGTTTVAYCIADQSGNNWEVGAGSYNGTTNVLTRPGSPLASSNSGSTVNFSSGIQDVFCTAPAKYLDTFTSTNQGTVPASGGGTTTFLRADGTFTAPPAATPASPTTSVQYNNAGSFGADASFTWTPTQLTIGPAASTITVATVAPTSVQAASNIVIKSSNAAATNGVGGNLSFFSGSGLGTGNAGKITFLGGSSPSGAGASVSITGGNGGAFGGDFIASAGSGFGTNGSGGGFNLTAGNSKGTGTAGSYNIVAGNNLTVGGAAGGDVNLTAGIGGNGAGLSGSLYLNSTINTALQITDDNVNQQIGFFNATPVAKPAPTASGTQAVLSGVVTALNSLGLVDSAALTNASTLTAAGSDTQVQYNAAGVFGANSNFTYVAGTNTLTLGTLTSPSGGLTITPFAPAAGTAPVALSITGAASQDANNGGAINITGGAALTPSTGVGGLVVLKGGAATSAPGGGFSMTAGNGTSGGGFTMTSGAGSSAASGGFTIGSGGGGFGSGNFSFGTSAGGAGGNSGNQSFSTGSSALLSGTTGSFNFTTGAQTNGGTSGSFNVNLGTSATGTGGSIILRPGNGVTKGSTRLRSSLATDVIQITDNGTNQIGFFAATPVVKQSTSVTGAAYIAGPTVGVFHTDDTYGGYTIGQIVAALQAYGLLT